MQKSAVFEAAKHSVAFWGSRVATSLLSLLFLHVYAKFVFILYLGHHGFFSYDFLNSTEFGDGWLFLTAELLLLAVSVFFFGWLMIVRLPESLRSKAGILSLRYFRGFTSFAFVVAVSATVWSAWSAANSAQSFLDRIGKAALEVAIPFLIAVYVNQMLTTSGARRIFTAIGLAAALVVVSFVARDPLANSVARALTAFGAGGATPISFIFDGEKEENVAHLVLLSPQFLHVRMPNKAKITTIPIDRLKSWSIEEVKPTEVREPKGVDVPPCSATVTSACMDKSGYKRI